MSPASPSPPPRPSAPDAGDTRAKVFCIGFQRTGTGSLARALEILGYRTKHNAKPLVFDLDCGMLDEYDAFADNPMPLLYEELDRRYPNARFILTERPTEPWLKSVQWLFTVGRVKNRWHEKPHVDVVHRRLYDRTTFDEGVFRERYEEHGRRVRAYFADRPDDLLILDVTRGDGWEGLCRFLGHPIPDQPFPVTHKKSNLRAARTIVRRALSRWLGRKAKAARDGRDGAAGD